MPWEWPTPRQLIGLLGVACCNWLPELHVKPDVFAKQITSSHFEVLYQGHAKWIVIRIQFENLRRILAHFVPKLIT